MSGTIEPPKIILKTIEINRYTYDIINLIPHTSAQYRIFCYTDEVEVKYVTGLLEGEQYKEWTTDDWLDRFIRQKVEELSDVEVKPEPIVPEPTPEPAPEPAPEPPAPEPAPEPPAPEPEPEPSAPEPAPEPPAPEPEPEPSAPEPEPVPSFTQPIVEV
jgi:hypothetical protein